VGATSRRTKSNAEGAGHWFPEHQGHAKTPADRGRFPPKCILRNDSLVLRFSYCDAQAIGLVTESAQEET